MNFRSKYPKTEIPRTTCFAALCKYRSWLERWLIHVRMKFFVNNIGISPSATRGRAFRKIWKPQCLRSGDDVEEKSDSINRNVLEKAAMRVYATNHQPLSGKILGMMLVKRSVILNQTEVGPE